MDNKIKAKRVGEVNIFEIFGNLTGSFADRSREAIGHMLQTKNRRNVLYNVENLITIDEPGVLALLQNVETAKKAAIVAGNSKSAESIKQFDHQKRLAFLKDNLEATDYFSNEFAVSPIEENLFPERRQFIRLKTVLPVRFWCETEEKKTFEFFAVVTNLSEGGLFAEFIESTSEDEVKKRLNPFDLPLLKMNVRLPGQNPVTAFGKIIHGSPAEGGIGVEFYNIENDDRIRMRDWIGMHLRQN